MAAQRDKYSSGIKNSLNDNDPSNDGDFDWNQIEDTYHQDGRRRESFQEDPPISSSEKRNRSLVVLGVALLLFWAIDWSPMNAFNNVRNFFVNGIAEQGLVESPTSGDIESSDFGFIQ